MAQLDGSDRLVELERGYAIRAPGLRGNADVHTQLTAARRSVEAMQPSLEEALAAANLTQIATIDLSVSASPAPFAASPGLRDARHGDLLELFVPDLGAERGQLVLSVNEAGGM